MWQLKKTRKTDHVMPCGGQWWLLSWSNLGGDLGGEKRECSQRSYHPVITKIVCHGQLFELVDDLQPHSQTDDFFQLTYISQWIPKFAMVFNNNIWFVTISTLCFPPKHNLYLVSQEFHLLCQTVYFHQGYLYPGEGYLWSKTFICVWGAEPKY